MTKMQMFEKIKELLAIFDELADYGLYDYEDKAEILYQTFKNFERIWGD